MKAWVIGYSLKGDKVRILDLSESATVKVHDYPLIEVVESMKKRGLRLVNMDLSKIYHLDKYVVNTSNPGKLKYTALRILKTGAKDYIIECSDKDGNYKSFELSYLIDNLDVVESISGIEINDRINDGNERVILVRGNIEKGDSNVYGVINTMIDGNQLFDDLVDGEPVNDAVGENGLVDINNIIKIGTEYKKKDEALRAKALLVYQQCNEKSINRYMLIDIRRRGYKEYNMVDRLGLVEQFNKPKKNAKINENRYNGIGQWFSDVNGNIIGDEYNVHEHRLDRNAALAISAMLMEATKEHMVTLTEEEIMSIIDANRHTPGSILWIESERQHNSIMIVKTRSFWTAAFNILVISDKDRVIYTAAWLHNDEKFDRLAQLLYGMELRISDNKIVDGNASEILRKHCQIHLREDKHTNIVAIDLVKYNGNVGRLVMDCIKNSYIILTDMNIISKRGMASLVRLLNTVDGSIVTVVYKGAPGIYAEDFYPQHVLNFSAIQSVKDIGTYTKEDIHEICEYIPEYNAEAMKQFKRDVLNREGEG